MFISSCIRTGVVGLESKYVQRFLNSSFRLNRLLSCSLQKDTCFSSPRSPQFRLSIHTTNILNYETNVFSGSIKYLHTKKATPDDSPESDEKLEKAKEAIQNEHKEEKPTGLFARLKYYLKRYWYIAIPIHLANSAVWFLVFYMAVKSGLDVASLMEKCLVPSYVVDKVKSVPPNAGVAVVAFLMYKITSPLRYASTLLLIQFSFPIFRRLGIMTAKEVKYKMRLKYTTKVKKMRRRYQLNRNGSFGSKKRPNNGGFRKS